MRAGNPRVPPRVLTNPAGQQLMDDVFVCHIQTNVREMSDPY